MAIYKRKSLIQGLTTVCLGVFVLITMQSSALAGNCDNPRYAARNPTECEGPVVPPVDPPGQLKMLEVTVRFADDKDIDDCFLETCIETTFIAVGEVNCSSQNCDFSGVVENRVLDGEEVDAPVFGITPALFNLLAMTSIRGTQLEPEKCYDDNLTPGVPYTETGATKSPIFNFRLRTPVVASTGNWWADVSAESTDMDGIPQDYVFKFGGLCDRSYANGCPALSKFDGNFDGMGKYDNGFVSAVWGTNTNKRNEAQTCRCTVSNKPGCPNNVDMGTLERPAVQILVVEL